MSLEYKNGAKPPVDADSDRVIREQFPINISRDNISTRREFLKVLALTSGAFFTGTAGLAVAGALKGKESYEPRQIAQVGQLKAGQATTFGYPTADDPCLLVHLGNDKYVAYNQKCTHLTCPVYWEPKDNRLECPCHEGAFDVHTGEVLSGPPPRPLPRIELKIENGKIYATSVNLNLKREGA